jgi:hypothetical protein
VLVVAGTFLPWLHSGSVTRNSYEAAGAIRGGLDVGPLAGAALRVWPAVSLACAAAAALYLLGIRAAGAVLVVLLAVVALVVAVGTLVAGRSGTVTVAPTGPAVTIAGAALALIATTIAAITRTRPGRVVDDRAAAAGPAAEPAE